MFGRGYHLEVRIHLRTLCLRTHSQTLCLRTCSENLFFQKLPANQGKMTNQLRITDGSVKIVGKIGKSSCERGRE